MSRDTRRYIKRKLLYAGKRFQAYLDQLEWPGKKKVFREWVARPGISGVIALTRPDHMLLVRQHRWGANRWFWEIPAGTFDKGDSPLSCARRECEEETGYKPTRIKSLGFYFASPAHSDEKVHLFVASGLQKSKMNLDYDERLVVKSFSIAEVKRMLKSGKIHDAKTVIALYRFFKRV